MREVACIPAEWLREISDEDRARIEEFLDSEKDREWELDYDEFEDIYRDK